MSFRDLLHALRRSWPVLAVLVLLGFAAGAGSTLLGAPTYRAQAQLYVATTSADSPSDLFQGATYVQIEVKNYAQLATTPIVLSPAIRQLHLRLSVKDLASRVHVTVPDDSTLLALQVEADSAADAVRTTNAVAKSLQRVATSLTPGQTSDVPPVRITLVEAADTSASRTTAGVTLACLVGGVGGLILGVAIALLREALRTRVSSTRDVESITASPVLATIRAHPRTALARAGTQVAIPPEVGSDYRTLASRIVFLRRDDGLHVFSVVSPRSGAGTSTSTLIINTARELAAGGVRTLVVDAAAGPHGVSEALGLSSAPGLHDAIDGAGPLRDLVQEVEPRGLFVLPRGKARTSGLLDEDGFGFVIEEASVGADIVLVDTPPALDDADAAVIMRRTAATLLVAPLSRLEAADLRTTLLQLGQLRILVSGVVTTNDVGRIRTSVRGATAPGAGV